MAQGPKAITFHISRAVTRRHLVGFVGLVLQVARAGVSYVGAMTFQYRQAIKLITPMTENLFTAVLWMGIL